MFTPEQKVELIDVVGVLNDTIGTVTADGVRIERVSGWDSNGIRYVDASNPEMPLTLREMSSAAYAAEFYKICGGSLDTADFDDVLGKISFVGGMLGAKALELLSIDELKMAVNGEERVRSSPDHRLHRKPRVWSDL